MVGFISEPAIEEDPNNQPSKLKTLDDTLAPCDANKKDFSFADSFLDFDSLQQWFEDNPDPDTFSLGDIEFGDFEKSIVMGDEDLFVKTHGGGAISHGSEPVVDGLAPNVSGSCFELKVKEEDSELEGNLGCYIQQEIEKVSLVGGSDSGSGSIGVEGIQVKKEIATEEEESESSEESESESEGSSSSSSSSSGSEDDSDDNEEKEGEEKKEVKVGVKMEVEDGEMEEGEIEGDGVDEMVGSCNRTENEENVDKMVGWSDDDDNEDEDVKRIFCRSDLEFNDDEDEDEGVGGMGRPIMSKNELQDLPPVPAVDVALQPHHQPLPVGAVLSIIGPKVIVEGVEKHNPLNEGSILWVTESRSPLGLVDEIFGPVKNPYYVVRYNSESEVPAGIHEGTLISFVPEFANHVLNDKNLYKKGYDASGENDEEVTDEAEFSDDEKEAEYRRMQKMTKRGMNDQKPQNKKKNRNRDKNKDGTWKNGGHSAQQTLDIPPNQNQPQVAASLTGNNCPSSTNIGPSFVNGVGLASPFLSVALSTGAVTPSNGLWTNGMPFQQPQSAVFPQGLPNNVLPWFSQNPQQQPYQMLMPHPMPFQRQFNPSQTPLPDAVLSGGQTNFFGAPNAPWTSLVGQNMLNQTAMGMVLQGQPNLPAANVVEQGNQQPKMVPSTMATPSQFNMGASSSHGRKPYHGRGGHFGRGRGRGRGRHQYK